MNKYKSIIEKNTVNDFSHSYKVLVVEDDDIAYTLLHEILSSYPLTLIRAYNGQEAVEMFASRQESFDLVLMDIRLPKLNGYDATQGIKEINPSVPVIAVTACAHSQGILDCYNAGCDDFISKPYDINKIVKMVEHYLVLRN